MKFFPLFIILLFIVYGVRGQVVSLDARESAKLKALIQSDTSAAKRYRKYEQLAEAALHAEPMPVDTVFSEGRLSTDPKKIKTVKSLQDIEKTYALALVYIVKGDRKYLNKTSSFLVAWALKNRPNGNPINDTKFDRMIEAFDLVKGKLAGGDKAAIVAWFSRMAEAEISSPRFSGTGSAAKNNWNSHRLLIIGMIGYTISNEVYKNYVNTALPGHIGRNLYPDGSGFDFHERDALHYHVYTLEPLLQLAAVWKRGGSGDYYSYTSPSGSSVKRSVEFLKPFVTGEQTHEEFVNSKVGFDRARANNKEANFTIGALFNGSHGARVFSLASYFDANWTDISRTGYTSKENYPDWDAVLVAVRK